MDFIVYILMSVVVGVLDPVRVGVCVLAGVFIRSRLLAGIAGLAASAAVVALFVLPSLRDQQVKLKPEAIVGLVVSSVVYTLIAHAVASRIRRRKDHTSNSVRDDK